MTMRAGTYGAAATLSARASVLCPEMPGTGAVQVGSLESTPAGATAHCGSKHNSI
jgi:hypothetical protein